MPGIKGMKRASATNAIRRQIWRSIRIMRRFSQADLARTVPGATMGGVQKYVSMLLRHGYIARQGTLGQARRNGEFQTYYLIRDTGPVHPTRCDVCGESLTVTTCVSPKEKETKKEEETKKEKEREVAHDAA